MGHIDGTHGCPQKTVFSLSTRASVRPSGWQKEVSSMVRMGAHRKRYFQFPPERLLERLSAKSGLKHAPQRRGYTRSLPMGPIDGTHGCPQKTVFSLSTRASVRPPGWQKDAYFWTAILRM
eukprot:gene24873-biopygen7435